MGNTAGIVLDDLKRYDAALDARIKLETPGRLKELRRDALCRLDEVRTRQAELKKLFAPHPRRPRVRTIPEEHKQEWGQNTQEEERLSAAVDVIDRQLEWHATQESAGAATVRANFAKVAAVIAGMSVAITVVIASVKGCLGRDTEGGAPATDAEKTWVHDTTPPVAGPSVQTGGVEAGQVAVGVVTGGRVSIASDAGLVDFVDKLVARAEERDVLIGRLLERLQATEEDRGHFFTALKRVVRSAEAGDAGAQKAVKDVWEDGNAAGILEFLEDSANKLEKDALHIYIQMYAVAVYMGETERAVVALQKMRPASPGVDGVLSRMATISRLRGDLDAAEEYYKDDLAAAEAKEDLSAKAAVLFNLGLLYSEHGDFDRALEMHRESTAIAEKHLPAERMMAHYSELGVAYLRRGDRDLAVKTLNKALEIGNKLGLEEEMAEVYGGLGVAYHAVGDLDETEEMFRKALAIYQRLAEEDSERASRGHEVSSEERRDVDRAMEIGWKLIAMKKVSLHMQKTRALLRGLAEVYSIRGDHGLAEQTGQEALEISKSLGRMDLAAQDQYRLALILDRRGKHDSAEEALREALAMFAQVGDKASQRLLHVVLGKVRESRGDNAGAREHWTKARELCAATGLSDFAERLQGWIDDLEKPPDDGPAGPPVPGIVGGE